MFRNLFVLFSTLMLGASAASAATSEPTKLSLEDRIQAAQKAINSSNGISEGQDVRSTANKFAASHSTGIHFYNYAPASRNNASQINKKSK
jgi:hypothetical protein